MHPKDSLLWAPVLVMVAAGCAGPEAWHRTPSSRWWSLSEQSALPLPARPVGVVAQVPVQGHPEDSGPRSETNVRRSIPSLRQGFRPEPGAGPRFVGGTVAQAPGKAPPQPPAPSSQERLAFFLASTSPGDFIDRQRGVDMPALLEELDDWDAVRLGALGPLRAGADILNRKRASVIVQFTHDFGPDRADVFTLYVVHTAFDGDLRDVLSRLGGDKRLATTLLLMPLSQEALRRRGLDLSEIRDRPERKADALRGMRDSVLDGLGSSEWSKGAMASKYSVKKLELPPPYQRVLDELEEAQAVALFSSRNVMLGCLDNLTLGMSTGLYSLVAGTYRGLDELDRGQYEQAGRELTPTAFVLLMYAGGKLAGQPAAEAAPVAESAPRFPELEPGGARAQAATRWEQAQGFPEPGSPLKNLSRDELLRLGGYLQAAREAALFVHDYGDAGALALHRARGNLAAARTLLAEVEQPLAMAAGQRGRAPASQAGTRGGANRAASRPSDVPEPPAPKEGARAAAPAEPSALVEGARLEEDASPEEVLAWKLAEFEDEEGGERMAGDLAALETRRPALDKPPPGVPVDHPVWRKYVAYWAERYQKLVEQRRAPVPPAKPERNPRTWPGYQRFFTDRTLAIEFENKVAGELLGEAKLPQGRRTLLRDFTDPRVERHADVSKGRGISTRYPDVVVLEKQPRPGQPPRVETFEIKRRDLRFMSKDALVAQFSKDAKYVKRYYGGVLELRRPSLKMLGKPVQVSKVHLIYDARLMPDADLLKEALKELGKRGVEIHFR